MNGELCLRLFAKFLIHISLLLWQLSHEFKFQTTAQNNTDPLLPEEEVFNLNIVAKKLGDRQSFSQTYCKEKGSDSSSRFAGVYCDCSFNNNTTCHIISIEWSHRGLDGYLPKEVANLTYLKELRLHGNEIKGEIPDTFGNLSRLYHMDLSNNQLTGPIKLGDLMLQFLYLENNLFTGPIPPSLGNMSDLVSLSLDRNQLNGSVPPELGKLALLQALYLSENQLSGSIPPELGNLTSLIVLDLSENQLSGPLPRELGKLTSLKYVYLYENQLSGPLPRELGKLTSLEYLYLYENQLNDALPSDACLLLQSNDINGNLSDDFELLTNLRLFSISGNYLSGPFPKFITKWTSIEYLSSYGNNFEGKIPPEIFHLSSLQTLEISDVGTSPFQFPRSANLTSITTLVLRNCSIIGPIPQYIGTMSSLIYFYVKSNNINYLKSSLEASSFKNTSWANEDLSFNNLTGGIPIELENLTSMSYMSFANNNLSGPIPAWISRRSANGSTDTDLSYNDFDDANNPFQRPGHPHIKQNLNLFSCCRSCVSNCTPELKGVDQLNGDYCPHEKVKNYSLHIKCGGLGQDIDGYFYDQDNSALPYQVSARPNGSNYWAFSRSGSFLSTETNASDYNRKEKCAVPVIDAPLYSEARLAPVSLKYYGLCLPEGNYSVMLHFSEIVYTGDDAEHSSLKRKKREFDIYIQNKPVQINFQINVTANETGRKFTAKNYTVTVDQKGLLEIHLYWAGKGSSGYPPDYNGPLISAISVTPELKPEDGRNEKLSGSHIAMIALGSITFALLLSLAFAWMMGWLEQESPEIKVGDDKTITLKQLIVATRGFSKDVEIGRGSFGTLYRAELPDNGIVAVKKLSDLSNEGIEKLNVGIYHLQNLRHENLVRLFDIYVGKTLCFLVYEYMENKSLADALFEHKIKLNWDVRFNICVGIAKGLQYLHEHPRLMMVHWGIKAANILLDGELRPKISDLGLASTCVENENETSQFLWMMKTEASTGYMAPEYPTIGKKSGYKYDVYSFGVVMLEIVCGRKNVGAGLQNKHEFELLVDEVCIADSKGKLPSLVDESLSGTYDMKQAMTILKLAMKCTHISPGVRPTMSQVVSVLADGIPLDEISVPASKEGD